MGIIQGNSRLSHHTITTAGMTFSVPSQEDFTIRGTSQSWTMASLALSEIGVNEGDKKAYIRIADTINELAFIGGVNGNTLEQVLHYGNNSSTYSIIMGTATSIKSLNGGAAISLDTSGLAKNIFISTDGVGMESSIEMTPSTFDLTNLTGNLTLSASIYSISMTSNVEMSAGKSIKSTNGGGIISLDNYGIANNLFISNDGMGVQLLFMSPGFIQYGSYATDSIAYVNNDKSTIGIIGNYSTFSISNGILINTQAVDFTTPNSAGYPTSIASQNSTIFTTATNSVIVGGNSFVDGIESNTAYLSKANIFGDAGSSYLWKHNTQVKQLTTATTSTIASIAMDNSQTMTIKCIVNAFCSSPNRNLGATLMASFLKYDGTIYQTSTTDSIIKDGFGDGTTATIDTDGTSVRIRVTDGAGLTTKFVVAYEYMVSGT